MDEYIKKNVLYEKIAQLEEFSRDRYLETPSDSPYRSRYMAELVERTYFKRIIADFPAEDVELVKHGRWIQQPLNGTHIWRCSKCETIGSPQWNYCPKCGTKMDERDE